MLNFFSCFENNDIFLELFTYEDMAEDLDTWNSTTSYLYTFVGGGVSWISRRKNIVSLSTTKVEYKATIYDCK